MNTQNAAIMFALYVRVESIELRLDNGQEIFRQWLDKLKKETEEMTLCDHELALGDYVEVRYKTGGGISGKIIEFAPYHKQAKVESGWCFHEGDTITKHVALADFTPNPKTPTP